MPDDIDIAFSKGNYEHGLDLLRKKAKLNPNNVALFHRLGVIEEQLGDLDHALEAHIQCIRLQPNNSMAYLYAGYCQSLRGNLDQALLLYSYAIDIDQNIINQWTLKNTPYETALRSKEASNLYRKHLSSLHKKTVISTHNSLRIKNAIWVNSHDDSFEYRNSNQRPNIFYIPALPSSPYYDISNLAWAKDIEQNYKEIKAEFNQVLKDPEKTGRPYLEKNSYAPKKLKSLHGSSNWTAFDLFKNGEINQAIVDFFPKTYNLLNNAPLYELENHPYEVFFSLLKPNQHIDLHYGQSNHSLTIHLPLIIPNDCYLNVNNTKHYWEEGKLVAFDDTFIHEAFNNSEEERIVLIFSIWHPELTHNEKADIKQAFLTRRNWLHSRLPLSRIIKE